MRMRMSIDFRKVNEYLISQGYDQFPFDAIDIDVRDDNEAKEAGMRYYNHILDWVSAQEAKGSNSKP